MESEMGKIEPEVPFRVEPKVRRTWGRLTDVAPI